MKNRKKYEKLPQDLDQNYQEQINLNATAAITSTETTTTNVSSLIDFDDSGRESQEIVALVVDNAKKAIEGDGEAEEESTDGYEGHEHALTKHKIQNFYADDLLGSSEEEQIVPATAASTARGPVSNKSTAGLRITTTIVGPRRVHQKNKRRPRKLKQKKNLTALDNNTLIQRTSLYFNGVSFR